MKLISNVSFWNSSPRYGTDRAGLCACHDVKGGVIQTRAFNGRPQDVDYHILFKVYAEEKNVFETRGKEQ